MVNTSYGLNLAARALPFERGDVVITSDREYPSNIYPWMELEAARGVKLERVPCAGVLPDEEAILAALDKPRVRALVLSWVSFATGYRIDVARIGRACRERGIWFVVDAIQGVGAAPLDVRARRTWTSSRAAGRSGCSRRGARGSSGCGPISCSRCGRWT